MPHIDYMDADVAYLLGMLVARGELLSSNNVFRLIVHFPKSALRASRATHPIDIDKEIRWATPESRCRSTPICSRPLELAPLSAL